MNDPNSNTLLRDNEAAAYMRLSVATIRSWRSRGKGPRYTKLGGRVYYRQSDLDSYIDQRTIDPTATAV